MKKLLLPLSLCVLAAAGANAQSITLTQTSFVYANVRGSDTLLNNVASPTYPPLMAQVGTNLDFTGVTSNTVSPTILYRVAGTGSNQWADSSSLSFSGFPYKAKLESSLTTTAYQQNGEHVDRAAYAVPGDPITTDSLVINGQDIAFSAPRTRIAFPASSAAGQNIWTSTYQFDFGFTLTLTPLGYTNAAGIVRAFVTERDTVIGYGKVRVNDKNGNPSGYMDVLQIEAYTTTVDSFYLNGAAASSTVLTAFGVTQGQSIVTRDQYYFRAGQISPLVHITFDATNSTPASTQTQADSLTSFTKVYVPETKETSSLNIYPNPVTNHTIMVAGAPANYGNWNYEVENTIGQVVTKGALQLSSNQSGTTISLNSNIAPGTYFLHLYNDANQQTVRTLTVK